MLNLVLRNPWVTELDHSVELYLAEGSQELTLAVHLWCIKLLAALVVCEVLCEHRHLITPLNS